MGIKNKLLLFFIIVFTAGVLSCGLDTFYTLEPPVNLIHPANIQNNDPEHNYVGFQTRDNENKSLPGFNYLGTEVYYRIYASSDAVVSFTNSVAAVNNSSNYNTAANKVISSGYKRLSVKLKSTNTYDNPAPLITTNQNDFVLIRLTSNNDIGQTQPEMYNSYIKISSSTDPSVGTTDLVPVREVSSGGVNLTFDFGRQGKVGYDDCKKPEAGDEDYQSGTVTDNKYYVDLYAFAVGRDTTYVQYYSNVLHLGTIVIKSSQEKN